MSEPQTSLATKPDVTPLAAGLFRPFHEFAAAESAGGIVLLACAVVALAWSNSPWSETYFELWERSLSIGFEGAALTKTIHHWINDGLMVLFFFLVGLEIKRELLAGELASPRKAALPIAAAFGGMIFPAGIYLAINSGQPGAVGWGVPMATDIAFALGVLALLGPRVPSGLKIFLAALAIVDDIGAVLVIAIFYTAGVSIAGLGTAGGVMILLLFCNWLGVRKAPVYAILGVALWFGILQSGIHATIAGVLLALTIPASTRIDEDHFIAEARSAINEFVAASEPDLTSVMSNPEQLEALHGLERSIDRAQSPLLKMEHDLQGIVAFAIMPLFALANAGVKISYEMLSTLSWRVVIGIVIALVIGKVLGVTLAAVASVRLRVSSLPDEVRWRHIHGVSWIAGIGFTMSLFIANLAFASGSLLESAKVGILVASIVSGLVGWLLLRRPSSALQDAESTAAQTS